MLYIKIISSIIICVIIISCFQNNENSNEIKRVIEQIKKDTKIDLPDFISIKEEENCAIGDYSKSFIIEFDSVNFKILIFQIERIIQNPIETHEIDLEMRELRNCDWKPYESGYKIENYFPENNKRITYYVNLDKKTLFYLFVED